jgi:hypothetical protein
VNADTCGHSPEKSVPEASRATTIPNSACCTTDGVRQKARVRGTGPRRGAGRAGVLENPKVEVPLKRVSPRVASGAAMDRKRQNHGGHRGADNGDPARRGTVVARYTNSLEPGAGPGGWRAPKKNKFYHPAEPPSKLVLRDRGGHLDTRGGAHDTKAQRGQVYAYARGAGRPLVFLLRVAVAVDVGRRPGTWQAAPSTFKKSVQDGAARRHICF